MAFDLRRAEPGRRSVLGWLAAIPAAIFVILAIFIATDAGPVLDLDDEVANWAYDVTAGHAGFVSFLDAVAVIFSNLACGIALALLAAFALYRRERMVAIWIVASGIAAIGGNALLKLVFQRDRPTFVEPLHEIGGYSFPSGHSAGAAMFFTVAILMTIILTGRGFKRRIPVTILGLLAIGVGASRIFLGVHYLSDVIAGLCFGMSVTLGLWILLVTNATRLPHGSPSSPARDASVWPSSSTRSRSGTSRSSRPACGSSPSSRVDRTALVRDDGGRSWSRTGHGRAARRGRPDHRRRR
ncbi:phosphatase PAP2 family protein [Aeromicrobium sp. UC242_57]|uniref:phosphatase PAP2 family protein n=1 Tax=Aeromicrobium sp. UC242_57 TaxID=3374624 RepID=UPI0037B652EE